MKLDELLTTARDTVMVRQVFAEPYEKDGVTIITGAAVSGGGGGGGSRDERGQEGGGGGFGLNARPTGAFIIKDGKVYWRPAVDVNRLVMIVGAVAMTYLFTRTRIIRRKRRRGLPYARRRDRG